MSRGQPIGSQSCAIIVSPVFFRCGGCGIAPLQQSKWLRTVRPEKAGEKGCSSQYGMWRCAAKYPDGACLAGFKNHGQGRVLVLTDLDAVTCGQTYKIVFLGVCNTRQDNVITMLKTAKLLEKSKWDDAKESMIDALEKLNEECENKLITLAECRTLRARTHADIEQRINWTPYCEDERLSINNGGMLYKALYVPPETKSLDDEHRDKVLASLVCFYDLSTCKPQPGCKSAGKKKAYKWMVAQQEAASSSRL